MIPSKGTLISRNHSYMAQEVKGYVKNGANLDAQDPSDDAAGVAGLTNQNIVK